jgi:hypothetical protein
MDPEDLRDVIASFLDDLENPAALDAAVVQP